jgi:hypothetical protein
MAHLIDKDALVAEITHKIKVLEAFIKNFDGISAKVEKAKNKIEALGDVLLLIENLEVGDVDLDTDFGVFWGEYCDCGGNINDYKVAKHFFELGIKAKQ